MMHNWLYEFMVNHPRSLLTVNTYLRVRDATRHIFNGDIVDDDDWKCTTVALRLEWR